MEHIEIPIRLWRVQVMRHGQVYELIENALDEITLVLNTHGTLVAERDELKAQRDALAEACQFVLARLNKVHGGGGFDIYDTDDCREAIRAALALARGE
jgi:hypothetical protein